jgi:hypothetical protein
LRIYFRKIFYLNINLLLTFAIVFDIIVKL